MRNIKRLSVIGAIVIAVAAYGPTVANAHTTSAPATPANMSSHPWPTNGCGVGPMIWSSTSGVFNFYHACVHHDGCYIGFPVNGRPTRWISRASCDVNFYSDMTASCQYTPAANRSWCYAQRDLYYQLVRRLGSPFYKGPLNN